jgi:hypothetical protein
MTLLEADTDLESARSWRRDVVSDGAEEEGGRR